MARAGLLIFDLDGTLFRTGPVTVEAARRSLAAFGVTPPDDDEITSFIGKPLEELNVWLRSLAPVDQASQICETFERLELELVPTIGAPFRACSKPSPSFEDGSPTWLSARTADEPMLTA